MLINSAQFAPQNPTGAAARIDRSIIDGLIADAPQVAQPS